MISILTNDEEYDNVQKILSIISSVNWTLKIQDEYAIARPLIVSSVSHKQLNMMIEPYGFTLCIYDKFGCSIMSTKTGRLLKHA